MPYTQQQWHDDTTSAPYGPINGTRLNYMEAGIGTAQATAEAALAAGGGASIGTAVPLMDGVASAGSGTVASAVNHVHPTDTSLAPLASPTFTGSPVLPTGTTATTQSAADSSTKLATTAFVTTADNLKANLASPTFTGTPVLPTGTTGTTQSASDNSTKLATTAYTDTGLALKANLASPTFTGTPTLPTGTVATTQAATDSSTALATTAYVMAKERAFILGKAGAIGATETNASDFNFCVPFNCTILRMKATLKTAASGSMIVQLRKAAATVTTVPTFSDVSSVLVTFASTNVLATATGFSTNLGEGDFLSFSCSTGSGTDLLVELVVVLR